MMEQEYMSLLELLEQEKQLCRKIRSADETLGCTDQNERIRNRMLEERAAAADQLPLVRVKIGAKVSAYEQMYAESIRNALGILAGPAEEGVELHHPAEAVRSVHGRAGSERPAGEIKGPL